MRDKKEDDSIEKKRELMNRFIEYLGLDKEMIDIEELIEECILEWLRSRFRVGCFLNLNISVSNKGMFILGFKNSRLV